jgi:PKD repeat protein
MKKFYSVIAIMLFIFSVSAQQIDRNMVLLEITTGIWCPNCPAAARGAHDLHANGDPVAIIENHGPINYDFANTYSVARNSYYGNSSYPDAQFDGEWGSVLGGSYGGNMYSTYLSKVNQRMAIQTSFDIEILGSYSGNNYDIIVRVTKVADYSGTNLRVRLALTESNIQYNWQGMTELDFVNQLMVPDANGTSVTFTSIGQIIDVPLSFTFDNAWDIDECELVAFIQDDGTKEALNAATVMVTNLQPAVPIAAFEGSPLSGYPPLSVDFTDLSSGLIDSWNWDFGDGNNSTSENPTNVYNNSGTYTVSLTVSGTGGTDTETIIDYVEVVPLPPAPVADFEGDVLTGQAPFTVHFSDLSSSVIDDWDWDFGNGGFSGLQNPSCTYTSPGTYTVSLSVSGPGGADEEIKVDYIVITAAAPEPDFTSDLTYGPVPLSVNFTDMSDGIVDTWLWEFGDGGSSTEQNPTYIFTDEAYFDVSLTVSGPGGTETITKEDFINTLDLVSVVVSASPEEICMMQSTELNAEASGGSETYTYSWTSDPEGFVSDEQSPMVSPAETTTYMVEVTDGEQVVNGEIEITVNPLPEITLGVWPEELCNQQEPPVQLSAMPEGGTYSGDHVTPEGVFSPEGATVGWHVITYTYEDENACENMAQDSIFVDACLHFGENDSENNLIKIYPNPFSGILNISTENENLEVKILTLDGRVLKVINLVGNNTSIDLSYLKAGVYIVYIENDKTNTFKKIIKR